MEKVLGKIEKVFYGFGGHDDAMFGLSVTLSLRGGGTGVADFKGTWAERSAHAQFTEEEWRTYHTETVLFVLNLLKEAKVRDVSQLVGTPIEAVIDQNTLKSWRILTEVL